MDDTENLGKNPTLEDENQTSKIKSDSQNDSEVKTRKKPGPKPGTRYGPRKKRRRKKKSETLEGAEKLLDDAQATLHRLQDHKQQGRRKRLPEIGAGYKLEKLACFDEVIKLIKDGYSIYDIARWIQEEKKEFLEVRRNSVVQYIYRYMRDHMSNADLYGTRLPSVYQMMSESMKEMIDGGKALSDLFHIQFDRMMIDYTQEKRLNRTSDSTTKNLQVCAEIAFKLEQIKGQAVTHGLKQSYQAAITLNRAASISSSSAQINNNERAIDQKFDEIKTKISEKYGERLGNIAADPLKRRKLLSIFDRMTKIGDPKFAAILDKYKDVDQQMQNAEVQEHMQTITLTVEQTETTEAPLPIIEG